MTGRTPARIAIALVAVAALAGGAGCRKDAPSRPKTTAPPPPAAAKADFKAVEVKGINPSDNPEAGRRADEESGKVIALLNEYYGAAFIDRNSWASGKHPRLAGLFTAEAQPALEANLGALALADLAPRLSKVTPSKQEAAKISFFIEDDLTAPAGAVSAVFEASAAAGRKSDGPVALVHTASFWLVREGDAYKIYAYNAELKADTQTKSAAFGTPAPRGSA